MAAATISDGIQDDQGLPQDNTLLLFNNVTVQLPAKLHHPPKSSGGRARNRVARHPRNTQARVSRSNETAWRQPCSHAFNITNERSQ
ncbi:hypothetical protein IscW_ISCW006532 [Ixodes scapularis]|uniref:Uncharacterized protein n=1 Tax=Ixodes scapularis TaxID=6945 RepID=B7PPF3_IXOSC|nr:hypothetical protein IscW_ISCW006532 [Ixodes scapularis]|eukprot:XP_002435645.1 hypothetical protein IscW_ISCW006532 [Ixodes scapularis]